MFIYPWCPLLQHKLQQLGLSILTQHSLYSYLLDRSCAAHPATALGYQQRPQVLAQYPLGLLEDVLVIHDEEQWPHAFSCEQVFLLTAASIQAPLLLLLVLLRGELGGESSPEGLLALGDDGVGPS